ncbi:uncharacterized protein LOC130807262 [Amaranthus tricolor]|uniref:uncharacterized protein LOC130807262 n=1 Tax=Amaranthus tricolor TaxID=29722 RepID=UPI0025827574|nr:uncharacterized protein LOC130807262 [Amaranthus tricolor]
MRFLFECVTCRSSVTNTHSSDEPSSPATPTTEETLTLVTSGPEVSNRRRRKRGRTRGSSSAADWKPTLFAISEDNAISASNTSQRPVNRKPVTPVVSPTPRNVKRCGSSSLVQVNARTRSYDYGREPLAMMFPAFTAAPFMF